MAKYYSSKVKKHIFQLFNAIKQHLKRIILFFYNLFTYLLNKRKCMRRLLSNFISKELNARPLKKGFEKLQKTSIKWIILALVANFGVGFCIIYFTNTFQQFWIHIVCITICMSLTIIIGRKYANTINLLDKEIEQENTSDNAELKTNYNRFKNYTFHRGNLSFCIVTPCIFFWGIFRQKYLSFDVVGIYGIFVISVTLFMSILGYVEYMWMLWLLYRISRCEHFHYNQSNPSQTPFLIYIADITNCAKWFFLVEGFLYIFEYFILIPRDSLTSEQIQMPDNLSFFITWIILFIVLVLAFPIIVVLQETIMTKIIDNLKQQQIKNLSICFNIASNNLGNNITIEQAYMCNSIMTNIIASDDYPIKARRFGPVLISIATFALHALNLLSQLPQISLLISQFQNQYL